MCRKVLYAKQRTIVYITLQQPNAEVCPSVLASPKDTGLCITMKGKLKITYERNKDVLENQEYKA